MQATARMRGPRAAFRVHAAALYAERARKQRALLEASCSVKMQVRLAASAPFLTSPCTSCNPTSPPPTSPNFRPPKSTLLPPVLHPLQLSTYLFLSSQPFFS